MLGEAFRLIALGALLGLPASYAAMRLVTSMLSGVQPLEPVSAALALSILVIAALLAVWIPARRAAGIDHMTALRYE